MTNISTKGGPASGWEEIVFRFRWQIALLLIGLILSAGGVFLTLRQESPKFEIVEENSASAKEGQLVVEVSGAVQSPGVFELPQNSRVEDAIVASGGISEEADTNWIERYLNRAAFLADGQKIYIPWQSDNLSDNKEGVYQSDSQVLSDANSTFVNINTATQSELEELPGIGPVYAKKIIDNRPYSNIDELISRKVVTQKIYDENKDAIAVY